MFRSLLLFGLVGSIMAVGQATGGQAGQTTGMSGAQSTGTAASGAAAGQGTAGGPTTAQPVVIVPAGPGSYGGLVENSGYVTTGAPIQGVVNPPLLAPPNAALPGSGPATGAPPSVDVNNPTRGGTGDVVFPGAGEVSPALNGAPPEPPAPAGTKGDRARNGILNTGMGRFESSDGNASPSASTAQSQKSIADVAREFKARRATDRPIVIDNSRIDSLSNHTQNNSSATPQTMPQSDNGTSSNPPPQAGLSQRDLAIVEAELARSRAASASADNSNTTASNADNGVVSAQDAANASSQPSTTPADNSANAQATSQETAPTAPRTRQSRSASANNAQSNAQNQRSNAQNQQQLPATASNLPLIGFLGLLAAGVGAIFAFRTRRN